MPHLRLIFLKSFILHSLTSCQCLYQSHLLQKEAPLIKVKDSLIYGNNFKSLGFSIILCPFNRTTVDINPLRPMTYFFCPDNGQRDGFYLAEQDFNLIRK